MPRNNAEMEGKDENGTFREGSRSVPPRSAVPDGDAQELRRDEPATAPLRSVRIAIWFVLGILVFEGFVSIERLLLPGAVTDEWFIGAAAPAAVYLWMACLNVLLGLVDVDSRDVIPVAGWGLVVAWVGFATGAGTYLVMKAHTPTLLASFGAIIPLFANVGVLVVGLFLTAGAYRLLGR